MVSKKKILNLLLLIGTLFFLFLLFTQGFLSNNLSWALDIDSRDKGCYDRGGSCITLTHTRDYGLCGDSSYIRPNLCNSSPSQFYRCCVPIDENKNQKCADLGGTCQWFSHTSETGSCAVDGREGRIEAGNCDGAVSNNYRCCVPLKEELRDKVISDVACENIGGECQETNSVGTCKLSSGAEGCYVFGACRTRPQNFAENDLYLCCVDVEEEGWCVEGVDYKKWRDVYLNGSCPFSRPSESDDRLWCSQGPDTTPSHHRDYTKPSVDIRWSRSGEPGTEYFIAPDSGRITKAHAYYENPGVTVGGRPQRCGCYMVFETDGGITYEIRHCFLFAGISRDFDAAGNSLGHSGLKVEKGEIIAKIALESDHRIIDIVRDNPNSCASGEHFHVKVTGIGNQCVDCYFVDDLGCNLFNDGSLPGKAGECGRCYRESRLPDCDEGQDERNSCDSRSGGCNIDPIQYCCNTDRIQDPETGEWYCVCPHSSPSSSLRTGTAGGELP